MARDKGDYAERFIEIALAKLVRDRKIAGYIHASKNREMDSWGIDFLVFHPRSGLALPLQVKWSRRRFGEHHRKHPLVKSIIAVNEFSIIFEYPYNYGEHKAGRGMDITALQNALIQMFNRAIKETKSIY